VAPLTALLEHSIPKMFSNSNTYSYHLATNSGYGPTEGMDVLDWQGSSPAAEQIQTFANPNDMSGSGTQSLAQIPWGTHPSGSTFHQHQLLSHENAGGLITGGCSDGSSGNVGPTTLKASGGTNNDGWTVTLHWKRANNTQAQAQVQVTDPIYDPYVHFFVENLLIEAMSLQNDTDVAT
jgi:hypothetical protein